MSFADLILNQVLTGVNLSLRLVPVVIQILLLLRLEKSLLLLRRLINRL
jgi:hypothetical protein